MHQKGSIMVLETYKKHAMRSKVTEIKLKKKRNAAEFVNIRTVLGLQGDVVGALALREARPRAFKSACVVAGLAQGL